MAASVMREKSRTNSLHFSHKIVIIPMIISSCAVICLPDICTGSGYMVPDSGEMPSGPFHEDVLQSGIPKGAGPLKTGQATDGFLPPGEIAAADAFCMQLVHSERAQLFDQMCRGVHVLQPAVVHQGHPVAQGLRFFHVVRGQKDRKPLFVQAAQKTPHLSPGDGIHAGSRFVQQEDLRLCQESAADHESAFHPSGEFPDGLMPVFGQSGEAKELFRAGADLPHREEIQTPLVFHDLIHIHVLTHGIFLSDNTDLPFKVLPAPCETLSVDADLSGGGQKEGGQHADGGGLAGSIGAQKSEKFAGSDRQADGIHGGMSLKKPGQMYKFDHVRCAVLWR